MDVTLELVWKCWSQWSYSSQNKECLLNLSVNHFGGTWVIHTWLHSLWKKVDKFNISSPPPQDPLQEGNKWFMQVVEEAGFTSEKEKKIINRF